MNISLLFWQVGLLSWLPLQPEQFMTQTNKSSLKTIQGLPSLRLLNEKLVIDNKPVTTVESNDIITNKVITDVVENDSDISKITNIKKLTLDINTNKLLSTNASDKAKTPINNKQQILNHNIENLEPVTKTITSKTCFQAGPYIKMDTIDIAVNWLENKYNNIIIKAQEQIEKKLIGTWVYLPPFKTLEETKRINQYLDKLGIKDHHIVRGKLKNAISLGVYSIPTNAEIRVKELKSKGYNNVKIRKRYKENTNYWLNIKMLVNQNNLIANFNKKFQNLTLISVTCESIALQ